jgi:hypothetical protein
MTRARRKAADEHTLGEKLLRSAQQARDGVNGRPGRVRVTYVPMPRTDARMPPLPSPLAGTMIYRWRETVPNYARKR